MGKRLGLDRNPDTVGLQQLLLALTAGGHACVCGDDDERPSSLLEHAGSLLPKLGVRVVRAAARGSQELGLPDLVSQIAGQWQPEIGGEDRLERAFLTLTAPGSASSHVALLIDNAHHLAPAAVHYLKFTSQSGPRLRIALAGGPQLGEALGRPEFGWLRQRFACELRLSALPNTASELVPGLSSPAELRPSPFEAARIVAGNSAVRDAVAMRRSPRSRAAIWACGRLGVAVASLLIGFWVAQRPGGFDPYRSGHRADAEAARAGGESHAIGPAPVLADVAPAPIAVPIPTASKATSSAAPLPDASAAPPEPATVAGPVAAPAAGDPERASTSPAQALTAASTQSLLADSPETVPASASGEIAIIAASPMAVVSAAPVPVGGSDTEIDAVALAPLAIVALAPLPVLLRSPSTRGSPLAPAAPRRVAANVRLGSDSLLGTSAAQRCRAIVIRTQLGEDPSNADREFLRRGCPTER